MSIHRYVYDAVFRVLANNRIETLGDDTFAHLKPLETLTLDKNVIARLSKDTFAPLSNLKQL